jgi:hypothetical protein
MPFPEDKGVLIQYQGGLGNQLWMVAAGFAAARTHGCPLYLAENPVANNKHNRFQQDYRNTVFSCVGERLEMSLDSAVAAAEAAGWAQHSSPGFEEWLPHDIQPGTLMTSYYQYYPGISRFQNEIRDLFRKGLQEQLGYVRHAFKPNDTVAFLHIRRGDYLSAAHIHYIQPLEYYRYCVADLQRRRPDLTRIIVFTDDVGWARRHAFFNRPLFQIVDIPNELESLALMSCCGAGAICANSTFSWWGAFLTGSENVYVPERWIAEKVICLFPGIWTIVAPETYQTEIKDVDTVFVTLTDSGYFGKAKRTIQETRGRGCWAGDIVLITVNFIAAEVDAEFLRKYRVQEFPVKHIHTDGLVAALRANPIKAMPDGRHFGKLTQWDKIYSFSPFFRRWRRVAFLDAGLRVLDSVQPLLDLQWEGSFLAPDDSEPFDNGNRFRCQLDLDANPTVLTELLTEYPQSILDEKYFLNCMYIYDTAILDKIRPADMEAAMNAYPISLCNEMGIMNLLITFKHGLWRSFPHRTSEGKYLFGWNERNYPEGPTWESFHFMKYPATT